MVSQTYVVERGRLGISRHRHFEVEGLDFAGDFVVQAFILEFLLKYFEEVPLELVGVRRYVHPIRRRLSANLRNLLQTDDMGVGFLDDLRDRCGAAREIRSQVILIELGYFRRNFLLAHDVQELVRGGADVDVVRHHGELRPGARRRQSSARGHGKEHHDRRQRNGKGFQLGHTYLLVRFILDRRCGVSDGACHHQSTGIIPQAAAGEKHPSHAALTAGPPAGAPPDRRGPRGSGGPPGDGYAVGVIEGGPSTMDGSVALFRVTERLTDLGGLLYLGLPTKWKCAPLSAGSTLLLTFLLP